MLNLFNKTKKNSVEEVRIVDPEEAQTLPTGIFGDRVQILAVDGILNKKVKLYSYPLDKVKLFSINDKFISLWIEGSRSTKMFFFRGRTKRSVRRHSRCPTE